MTVTTAVTIAIVMATIHIPCTPTLTSLTTDDAILTLHLNTIFPTVHRMPYKAVAHSYSDSYYYQCYCYDYYY